MTASFRPTQFLLFAVAILWPLPVVCAVETVTFKSDEKDLVNGVPSPTRTVTGEVLVKAIDGGLMLQSDDGRIWTVQPEQIMERRSTDKVLVPLSADEMAKRMTEEMPEGFSVYQTAHYLIVHNTSNAYARDVGSLFERLHRGFYAYWGHRGWKLPDPKFPLVALVLANKNDFLKHASAEVGDAANDLIGYYHLSSNRMTTFNVPNMERNVATIIHEATHQLAYNCGVQQRFADNPMWVSEGIATFFESPDFTTEAGWHGIGRVNQFNLGRWRNYLPNRPENSLATLLCDDSRFRNSKTAEYAYAEGWALTFFLLKTKRKQFVNYMKKLSEGKPMAELTPRQRIDMFEAAFGESVAEIDRDLVIYMNRLR